jgi:hypothetical protein
MLISELVRCGFTIQYTSTTEIAAVASTAKNTSARIIVASLVYQRLGYRNSFKIDMMIPHYCRLHPCPASLFPLDRHFPYTKMLARTLLTSSASSRALCPIYIGGRT